MSLKRKSFSVVEKYAILKEIDAGAKHAHLEQKHGISHGILAGFLKNRMQIDTTMTSAANLDSKSCKTSRYPEIDEALLQWFKRVIHGL